MATATLTQPTASTTPAELPGVALPRGSRWAGLDLLRGVAILLVMGRHMYVTAWWHDIGWFGVQLFFVLSGFLVSGLLFREYQQHGRLDLRRFLVRRALKIYPSFFCFLLVTLPLAYFTPRPPRPIEIASELLFLQSYSPGYWEHTWSLAVEEHFYALLTLGMLLACRRLAGNPFQAIPRLAVAVGILSLAARAMDVALPLSNPRTQFYATHVRLDALTFGTCLAYWYHCRREALMQFMQRHRSLVRLFTVVALASVATDLRANAGMMTLGLTVSYLGAGTLLLCLLDTSTPKGLPAPRKPRAPHRFLCWLGRHSYAIYLWHMLVAVWGVGKIKTLLAPDMPYAAQLALYFALSITLGAFATWLVEQPVLRLRDRWYPSRTGTPGPLLDTSRLGML